METLSRLGRGFGQATVAPLKAHPTAGKLHERLQCKPNSENSVQIPLCAKEKPDSVEPTCPGWLWLSAWHSLESSERRNLNGLTIWLRLTHQRVWGTVLTVNR